VVIDASVLALAGVVVAGLAAVASPFASLMIAKARNDHEVRLAASERRQRRRETAYGELVPYLIRTRDSVARTEPMWERTGDPGPPEQMTEDELRRIETEVALHGSAAVLDRLQALAGLGRSFALKVEIYRDVRSGRSPEPAPEGPSARAAMDATRQEMFETIRGTLALVNEELGSD